MSRALEHITVTTGATRLSPRSEVEDAAVRHIQTALTMRAGDVGGGWVVSVHDQHGSAAWIYDLLHQGVVVVSCALCAQESLTDALWEVASGWAIDERVTLHRPRGVPWLAAALGASALTVTPDILFEAGDLERCVAWALLERA